jgi:hypothetical protein
MERQGFFLFLVEGNVGKSGEKALFRLRFRIEFFGKFKFRNFKNSLQRMQETFVASAFVRSEGEKFWEGGDSSSEENSFVCGGVCCHVVILVFF